MFPPDGETAAVILFFIGLCGLIAHRSMIKSIISLGIMEAAVILFFLADRIHCRRQPPIADITPGLPVADPLPQALMLTEIVIGIAVVSAALVMVINLSRRCGTTDWHEAAKKGRE